MTVIQDPHVECLPGPREKVFIHYSCTLSSQSGLLPTIFVTKLLLTGAGFTYYNYVYSYTKDNCTL